MSGWIIQVVTTPRMGGGKPVEDLYIAAVSQPEEAMGAVEQKYSLTPDQIPEPVYEVSDDLLRRYRLASGEVGIVTIST